jgi:coenzyme PQQ biosynthesis protein PqqD
LNPKLSRKARVRPDPRDGRPVLLSPERGLRLGDSAAAIVALCDGTRDVDAIVAELALRYGAEPGRVATDVHALLGDLHDRALIEGYERTGAAPEPAPAPAPAPASADTRPSRYNLSFHPPPLLIRA